MIFIWTDKNHTKTVRCGSKDIYVQMAGVRPDRLFISQEEWAERFPNQRVDKVTARAARKYLAELHKTVRFIVNQGQVILYNEQ